MKSILYTFMIVTCLSMTSCITTRSTTKINQIELGMTKEDIRSLLGTPVYRNAWQEGEQWGYHKQVGEIAGPEQVLLVISFDADGKVTEFETQRDFPHRHH
ncbi:MAG: outer membrane protein assembly factor BamE [Bacteroidales bacterium]|nr:outer membrane protein assembly factor BamE [Bacteroidales bacterium]